jgi:hypothetical protein
MCSREPNVKVVTFQQMCLMIMIHTLNWKEFDNLDELTFEKWKFSYMDIGGMKIGAKVS